MGHSRQHFVKVTSHSHDYALYTLGSGFSFSWFGDHPQPAYAGNCRVKKEVSLEVGSVYSIKARITEPDIMGQVPALILLSCVTLDKYLTSLCLNDSIEKEMTKIILGLSWKL